MRIDLAYGRTSVGLDISDERLVPAIRGDHGESAADPALLVAAALDEPTNYPPLHRALTPDDHIAIVVDERLPQLTELLSAVLDHLARVRIAPEAVTLVCPPSSAGQPWLDDLPDVYQEVKVEIHDPNARNKLSYLATTKQGRRIYLNRTVVDADQSVVLAGCRYDPVLGQTDGVTALYPTLSDEPTRTKYLGRPPVKSPGAIREKLRQEMSEVVWLLGAPFLVQLIEGSGDRIARAVGGAHESAAEGRRLLDARWRVIVKQPADLVVATVAGDPSRHDFAALAAGLAAAARVVTPNGQIVLLSQAKPSLGPAFELIRQADSPQDALEQLADHDLPDRTAARQWLEATRQARVYLLCDLDREVGEELFVTPLDRAEQAQRLVIGAVSCLLLPDANKTLALLGG